MLGFLVFLSHSPVQRKPGLAGTSFKKKSSFKIFFLGRAKFYLFPKKGILVKTIWAPFLSKKLKKNFCFTKTFFLGYLKILESLGIIKVFFFKTRFFFSFLRVGGFSVFFFFLAILEWQRPFFESVWGNLFAKKKSKGARGLFKPFSNLFFFSNFFPLRKGFQKQFLFF